MFDPKDFPFDPAKMAEFFKTNDFANGLTGKMTDGAEGLAAAQKKNMDALVAANQAAAASYQDMFAKQVEVFEKTFSEAKEKFGNADADSPEAAKATMDAAIANMKELAASAQKANSEAMEIVGKRVTESLNELKDLSKK